MKRIIRILAVALLSTSLTAGNLFKGRFKNIENQLNLHIDLYEESLSVPGLEMFGPMHGYVNGQGVYNVWYITKVELKGTTFQI